MKRVKQLQMLYLDPLNSKNSQLFTHVEFDQKVIKFYIQELTYTNEVDLPVDHTLLLTYKCPNLSSRISKGLPQIDNKTLLVYS